MWEGLTEQQKQWILAAGHPPKATVVDLCKNEDHYTLFCQYIVANGGTVGLTNAVRYLYSAKHPDRLVMSDGDLVNDLITEYGPGGPYDCDWDAELADWMNQKVAGMVGLDDVPDAYYAYRHTYPMAAMWDGAQSALYPFAEAYGDEVFRIITASEAMTDSGGIDQEAYHRQTGAQLGIADLDRDYIDTLNKYVLDNLPPGGKAIWHLASGILLLDIGDTAPESYVAALKMSDSYEAGRMLMAAKGSFGSRGSIQVEGCTDEAAFKAAYRRVSDKSIEHVDNLVEASAQDAPTQDAPTQDAQGGGVTVELLQQNQALLDRWLKSTLDSLEVGDETQFLQVGSYILTGDAITNWREGARALPGFCGGYLRRKTSKGRATIQVIGSNDPAAFKEGFRRVSDKLLQWED